MKSRLQILPRNTHLQNLIYEISPKTTNLHGLTLTKLIYEIHLQELNYRNYKILRRNTHLQKLIYEISPTTTNLQEHNYQTHLRNLT